MIAAGWDLAALIVFSIAALTDAFDGALARAMGQASALGRQLDPLVDKVMICSTLIFLLPRENSGVGAWMVAAIVSRELLVQALRSLVEGQGSAFGAKWMGKLKTLTQCLAIVAVLWTSGDASRGSLATARDILLWSATILTITSGLTYLSAAIPLLRASRGA
jgi:CDP-diacylglycerol--glycerol-3-phosphate 3-phosphatidyltransferase